MVVVALLSVYLVESVYVVSVDLVVNCIVEYSSDDRRHCVYVCILHLLYYKMYEKRSQINKLRKVQNINI